MIKKSKTGSYHEAHSLFSLQIKFLSSLHNQDLRGGEIVAINVLLIAASTAFIESVLSNMLMNLYNVHTTSTEKSDVRSNIHKYQHKEILRATFSKQKDLICQFTGKSFDKFSNLKSFTAVQRLFDLRNHLMHGKNLGLVQWFEIDENKEIENQTKGTKHLHERKVEIDALKEFQKYLEQEKLICGRRLPREPMDVLSLSILKHFLQHAVDFTDEVHTAITSSYGLHPIFMFDRSIEALRRELVNLG